MRGERILDASVVGAAFFEETASKSARDAILSPYDWIAPDLIFAEIASLTAKKLWRSEIDLDVANRAIPALRELLANAYPAASLASRALTLAAEHRFSAYDGLYLALAEQRGSQLVTGDLKLAERARTAGLGHLVIPL